MNKEVNNGCVPRDQLYAEAHRLLDRAQYLLQQAYEDHLKRNDDD